jgi:hypothetical protein
METVMSANAVSPTPSSASPSASQTHEPRVPLWPRWELWKRVLGVLGTAAAIATVWVGVETLRQANALQADDNHLQRAALDSHLEEVMMGIDRHFVRYAHLRPFFYASGGAQAFPARPGRVRYQALATAELIIDFADDVGAYARNRKMAVADQARWARIASAYFDESPVTRLVWKRFSGAYDRTTACILGAPYGRALDSWDWRANAPRTATLRCPG